MADVSESKQDHDSDSDASFLCFSLSDIEEMKLQATEELQFVDSYYHQEKPANGLPESGFDSASFPFQDSFSEDPSSVLPWDRFSSWIHCFAVVTFDLEIGQMIEEIYPSHVILSEQDKTSLCYLAFPDSNSGCMGDTQFHFRIKQSNNSSSPVGAGNPQPQNLSPSVLKAHSRYNQLCPAAYRMDPSYLWGFAYFRQVKDRSLRRGYFQKSLVIVTRLPFVELFQQISSLLAPEFFEKGSICLEASAKEIDQWPSPIPGGMLNLPLMGTVFQVKISCFSSPSSPTSVTTSSDPKSPQHSNNLVRHRCLLATNVELYSALAPVLPHLHLLWELLLCGEPLVVMATSPSICSHVVQALINLINPLQYCLDYRPFFTIHDPEFKEYTARCQDPPPVLLGVTNPFFAKALQHWPHIIRIGEMPGTSNAAGLKIRIKKLASPKVDCKPGVYTSYKPYLQRDKVLLKIIAKGVQTRRPNEVQSALMRRHFLELTQSFIIPLERYMARLMPLQKTISPYKAVPVLNPFKAEEFLASVDQCGPQLTTGVKGDWTGLYQRFLRTPNFDSWFKLRRQEANRKLHALQMEALSQSDMVGWLRGKREVEVVDMILRIREKLDEASVEALPISPHIVLHLQGQQKILLDSLPEDLRSMFQKDNGS